MIQIYCKSCNKTLQFHERILRPDQTEISCPFCHRNYPIPKEFLLRILPATINHDIPVFLEPAALKISGNQPETKINLKEGIHIVGRKADSSQATLQICTDDKFMGRMHARIEVKKDAHERWNHYLKDLNSKNGTFHNDYRLQEGEITILMPGDTLRIGKTTIHITPS
ncbi:MAG: FHA domain-containing protein [Bacteroidales bacterium]|nr:FHA domain-containing protein [Bacteroidales bacterium]